MTTAALRSRDWQPTRETSSAPRLRLLPKATPSADRRRQPTASADRRSAVDSVLEARSASSPVLIAGRDALTRAELREELSEIMPLGTRFEESGTFWELLERAPSSRMVVLGGDLDELPAETLLHTLGQRYPDLPVVSLEATASN